MPDEGIPINRAPACNAAACFLLEVVVDHDHGVPGPRDEVNKAVGR
jgi:hypothetical protein